MESKVIVLIAMIFMLVIVIVAGILLKRYTSRKLKDIDGAEGIVKQGDIHGKPLTINIVDERGKNDDERNND